jgi:hypothetical protein
MSSAPVLARRGRPRKRLVLDELEDEFTTWVIDCAQRGGWAVVHFRPAQTTKGWRTPVQGDGKGWVDLTLVRERFIYAELKKKGAYLKPEQRVWRGRIEAAGGEYHLWRPPDRPAIQALLLAPPGS